MTSSRLSFYLPALALLIAGCSPSERQIEDMVERQMDAMVFVEGGEFMMGDPGGWDIRSDSRPPFKVILDDYYIQKYEVTQKDLELFKAATGYETSHQFYERRRKENPDRFAAELPAMASWKDARAFCQWLGEQTGKNVDLPTEAQWEFAARARGQMLQYATENGKAIPDETMAEGVPEWMDPDQPRPKGLPKPPGSFPPNPLGLYDMSGNVFGWVRDYYQRDHYENVQESSPLTNPKGPEQGEISPVMEIPERVLRGGSYRDFRGNTTTVRVNMAETIATKDTGFRCARAPSPTK